MPSDMFCKIDGVTAESTDSAHKGEIEITSFSLGFSQASMVATSAVGGATGARADLTEFSIMKLLDSSSPTLMKFCCTGKHVPSVVITVSGANDEKTTYLSYTLSDVVISNVSTSGSGGGVRPSETVSFRYGKISMTYTPYDAGGKKGSDVKAGWDATTNKAL